MFLAETVIDLLANSNEITEIIVVLDGEKELSPLPQSNRLKVIRLPKSIGQRASQNLAARTSSSKYLMKIDAHCSAEKDFDLKMIEAFEKEGDNVVMVPIMRNLHVFNWVCKNGHIRYQGPTKPRCEICGTPEVRDVVWIPKTNPQSKTYCFDSEPHFQYFNEYKERPEFKAMRGEKQLTESMSLQGSCFMVTRDKYWEYKICDESFGSWGSQGIEVATKFWLRGGRVLVNHNTWYAHMFRTQGGDFGFPYEQRHKDTDFAKKKMRSILFKNKLENQKLPTHWLLDKFWPVKGWTDTELEKLRAGTL